MSIAGSVLVTGASSGIGRACALDLEAAGFRVFAGVRKASDGEALRAASSGKVTPVILDVVDYASVQRAGQEVAGALGGAGLDGLVNNAGISVAGPLEYLPMELFDQQLKVNVSGQVAVTQAFLPLLRKARGRVVFISSESGRVVLPMLGAYAASKHALEAVADAFRRELRPSGVKVCVVEPGSIKSSIWDKAKAGSTALRAAAPAAQAVYGRELAVLEALPAQAERLAAEPRVVTRAVLHALTARSPRIRYLVGPEARLLVTLHALTPSSVFDWCVASTMGVMSRATSGG
jgi:NAD(P)-dependent dehydrogenase (short-subunit alcohol dehydrogenase family)